MAEVTMPRLSDTMQEGTILKWYKQPGDRVERGESLVEIETDKATMPLEAYESGVLEEIKVREGQTVPVGELIAVIGGAGKRGRSQPQADRPEGAATPPAQQIEAKAATKASAEPSEARAQAQAPGVEANGRVRASPLARRIANEHGIDLKTIVGSGPAGRVVRKDVEAALAGGTRQAPSGPAAPVGPAGTPTPPRGPDAEKVALSNIRRVIARRMTEAQLVPQFYLTRVADVTELLSFRAAWNEQLAASDEGMKISLTELLVRASALALRKVPEVNVSFGGDHLLQHRHVNIGIAVALQDGLIVPVIRDADLHSLREIAGQVRELSERARSGKLAPAEFSGGTFTISNLGMYGIEYFTALINPPEAAILAVGASVAEPTVRGEQVVIRQRLRLTLACDHRSLDGATGARFLQELVQLLEKPMNLVA